LDRRPEETLLPLLQSNGIAIMVRGALAKGILAGKESSNYLDYKNQVIDLLINKMRVFSNENTALNHIALQWVLSKPAVTSVVLGMRTLEQLRSALSIYHSNQLTTDELNEISSMIPPNFYTDHR
jgi:aryl-alcohol dehydrogenase-like predicted oxidoreductase